MKQGQKSGRRFVSLSTYIANMSNKLVLSSFGLMIYASVGNFSISDLFPFAFLAFLFGGGGAALLSIASCGKQPPLSYDKNSI